MRVVKRVAGNVVFYRCENKRFYAVIVDDGGGWEGGGKEKKVYKKNFQRGKKLNPSQLYLKFLISAFTKSYKMLARLSTIQSILISIFLPLLVNRALPF